MDWRFHVSVSNAWTHGLRDYLEGDDSDLLWAGGLVNLFQSVLMNMKVEMPVQIGLSPS